MNYVLNEKINIEKLTEYALTSNEEKEVLTAYISIAKLQDPDPIKVEYYQSVAHEENGIVYERKFAKGHSLQKLSRGARQAACHEIGVEIDIQNAHPTLLLKILEENAPDHNK